VLFTFTLPFISFLAFIENRLGINLKCTITPGSLI
jgi:hypothetical protein